MKLYALRLRQPDGSWVRDPTPMPLKEAKKSAQFNRIMGGIICQILPANEEEIESWENENQPTGGQP